MKLVIADDEQDLTLTLKNTLVMEKVCAPSDIRMARDGAEAILLFKEFQPDIVITDLKMPNMGGPELIQQIRQISSDTQIIVMTGYAELDTTIELFRLQVADFLRKPFNFKEAARQIERIGELIQLKKDNDEYKKNLFRSEKLAALGTLISGIAHEINNPNAIIRGNLEILQDFSVILKPIIEASSAQPENDQKTLELIQEKLLPTIENAKKGSQRIEKTIKSMLSFVRLKTNDKEPTSVYALVDEVFTLARGVVKNTEVKVRLAENLPLIQVTPQDCIQVLLNLVINAAHAVNERHLKDGQGCIEITAALSPDQLAVLISVKDNGTGMSPDVQERMFDAFFTTKKEDHGTGLGLWVCKNLIEANGGTIDCASGVGQGTQFVLRFPCSRKGSPNVE